MRQPVGDPIPFRRARGNDGHDARRMAIFRLTAPIFAARGYREATIKELAHAAHLSPAALYHYFPSKLALATYPLRRDNSPEAAPSTRPGSGSPLVGFRDRTLEPPLEFISRHLDIFADQLPLYLLAIDLAGQAGMPLTKDARARLFGEGHRALVPALLDAAPALPPADATEIVNELLALLVAPSVTGLLATAAATREAQVRLLRERLLRHGVDAAAFEAAMLVRDGGHEGDSSLIAG